MSVNRILSGPTTDTIFRVNVTHIGSLLYPIMSTNGTSPVVKHRNFRSVTTDPEM